MGKGSSSYTKLAQSLSNTGAVGIILNGDTKDKNKSANKAKIFDITGCITPELVFFDFDRTLCVHDYPMQYQASDNYEDDCYCMLNALDELHAADRPLKCMQWFARKLRDNGANLFCLTHEIHSLRDGFKIRFLKDNYADTPMQYIAVDSTSHKIDMIKAIARTCDVPLIKCMLIEDRMQTIIEANAAGIQSYHVSNVMLWSEGKF